MILRRAVPPALRGLLLALAGVLFAAPAQASLPSLNGLARAADELHARPSPAAADLPRELPSELPKECNGPFCVEPLKTRVRGFDLRLSCSIGGEDVLTCGSRLAYGLGYGGRAVERSVFTGHVFDTEIQLYYAKARYFDPKLGRFLTQDSFLGQIDEPPSLHRYLYANGNPTTFVDPTGHAALRAAQKDELTLEQAQELYAQTQAGREARELPRNAPDPAIVEESPQPEPGVLSKAWSLMDSWRTGKKAGGLTRSASRQALNADDMSDEAADRARAFGGAVPSGMNQGDIRNISQGDRGAIRSGASEAAGAFTAVGIASAIELAKQYGMGKVTKKLTEVVSGAGTRLKRLFRRSDEIAEFGGVTARTSDEASFLRNASKTFSDSDVYLSARRFEGQLIIQRSDIPWSVQNVRLTARGNTPFVRNASGQWERINLHHVGRREGRLIEVIGSENRYDNVTGGPLHIPGPGGPARDRAFNTGYWQQRLRDAVEAGQVSEETLRQVPGEVLRKAGL